MKKVHEFVQNMITMDRVILGSFVLLQLLIYKVTIMILNWLNKNHQPTYIKYECYNYIRNNINTLITSFLICCVTLYTLIYHYPWESLLYSWLPNKEICYQQFAFPMYDHDSNMNAYDTNKLDVAQQEQEHELPTLNTPNIFVWLLLYQSSYYIFDIISEYLQYYNFIHYTFNPAMNNGNNNNIINSQKKKQQYRFRLSQSQIYKLETRKEEQYKYFQYILIWRLLLLFEIFAVYQFNLLNEIVMVYIIIGLPQVSSLILIIGNGLFAASKTQNTIYIHYCAKLGLIVGILCQTILLLIIQLRYLQCILLQFQGSNKNINRRKKSKKIRKDFDIYTFVVVLGHFLQIIGFVVHYIVNQWWLYNIYQMEKDFPKTVTLKQQNEYITDTTMSGNQTNKNNLKKTQ